MMYDDYGPAPIDSYDLYAMGLRTARCNGCRYAKLTHELGDKCLVLYIGPRRLRQLRKRLLGLLGKRIKIMWTCVYELDAEPAAGQGKPKIYKGRSIRHRGAFPSVGHSDECYHWKPPREAR